jgi:hypothetical protein
VGIELSQTRRVSREREDGVEDEHDRQGDRRTGEGDEELLLRLVGNALQPGDSADGKQDDIRSAHPESAGHENVAEFMEQHAGEEGEQQDAGGQGTGRTALLIPRHGPERDQDEESEVDLDLGPRDAPDRDGPAHGPN